MKNNQNHKLRNQINKLKHKLDNQEQVLVLEKPVKENFLKHSIEKISIYSSILITVSAVCFGLFEFYNFNEANKNNNVNSFSNYTAFISQEKLQTEYKKIYGTYNLSKNILNSNHPRKLDKAKDQIKLIKEKDFKISELVRTVDALKISLNSLKKQNSKILIENKKLIFENSLVGKKPNVEIKRLEEALAALNSKTKIQNQKLTTAISMINNLQLERINLLSELNFPNNSETQISNLK